MAQVTPVSDQSAPMAAAPIKYAEDGRVDWGNMWDTFCVLAQAGGPPHRGTLLAPPSDPDTSSPAYQAALQEIARGITAVSGLKTRPAAAGWLAVICGSAAQARWLRDAICEENVQARAEGSELWLPVDGAYRLTGEIKNVITVAAKTTHYWNEHVAEEIKRTLAAEAWLDALGAGLRAGLRGWLRPAKAA